MPVTTLALLFHLNQHVSQNAQLASTVCYVPLLQTLLARPYIRANIHISGTLIHALRWFDSEPLHLIKQGADRGQFEIIGSTYAQNVPYATDDRDNAAQIAHHRTVLAEQFSVVPTTFWNPERCWRQSLLPVIHAGGYAATLLESGIWANAGLPRGAVAETTLGQDALKLIYDDEPLKHWFNMAAWFGRNRHLHGYLDAVSGKVMWLAYAEDAEAMGLWGYHAGLDPRPTFDHLGVLLDELDARPDVAFALLRDAPAATARQSPIPDGSAAWMDGSLAAPGRPYHEEGYTNWFDFNANAPRLHAFRAFYDTLRPAVLDAPAGKLHALATQSFLAHQYEFGCVGIGRSDFRGWRGAEMAEVLVRLAGGNHAAASNDSVTDFPLPDGIAAYRHDAGATTLLTTPIGGRLLFWLDHKAEALRVGNPGAIAPGDWHGVAQPPPPVTYPPLWLPTDQPPTTLTPELPPTRMARFLPDDCLTALGDTPLPLPSREMALPGAPLPLPGAQQGAFADTVLLEDRPLHSHTSHMHAQPDANGITYSRWLLPGLHLAKQYRHFANGVTVEYVFNFEGDEWLPLTLRVHNELVLDYAVILRHGRAVITPHRDGAKIVNQHTGDALTLTASPPPTRTGHSNALLAYNLTAEFDLRVAPNAATSLELKLTYQPGASSP